MCARGRENNVVARTKREKEASLKLANKVGPFVTARGEIGRERERETKCVCH